MKTIAKHFHSLIGTLLFAVFSIALLLLFGFTTKLPLPEELGVIVTETLILDFSISEKNSGENSNSSKSGFDNVNYENYSANNISNAETTIEIDAEPSKGLSRFNFSNVNYGDSDVNNDNANNSDNPGDYNGKSEIAGMGVLSSGRKIVYQTSPESKENMFGKLVIQITVNANGDVVTASVVSTNCSECVKSALDAVKKWKYEKNAGSGLQTGNVVIEFLQTNSSSQ